MQIQMLVATMYQKDFSLFDKMNIQNNVIFANQDNENRYEKKNIGGYTALMRSTDTKGVGKNRNIALLDANADILLLSDDDMEYFDGYSKTIIEEFQKRPDADAIVFNIEFTKNEKADHARSDKSRRLHIYNALQYGAAGLAVKRDCLLKYNIHFSEVFGGGCIYGSGEDSIFILDLMRHGCKVYATDAIIARSSMDSSTWFTGFNKKYFFDKGALFRSEFPKWKLFIKLYFLFRCRNLTEISFREMMRQMNWGMKGFEKLMGFNEWNEYKGLKEDD